jgi:RES domain-containing protein
VRWRGTCYRAHAPKYAFDPLSGEGARIAGGRFNPVGMAALYLAASIETMLLEQGRGFSMLLPPLTICAYLIDIENIVDLRTPELCTEAGFLFDSLACPWRQDRHEGRTPASWLVAKDLLAKGANGILVPSFANGARPDMTNLVLWHWDADNPHQIKIHDPHSALPKDQSSWH